MRTIAHVALALAAWIAAAFALGAALGRYLARVQNTERDK